MRGLDFASAAVVFLGSVGALAAPAPPAVEDVLARLDDLYRSQSSVGVVELSVVKPSRTHTLRLRVWTSGEERALIVVEAPARDKGMATLKVDKNLWNYMPKVDRTIRIPPSMMQSSWMGSDFTNDDLVRESSLLEDFDSRLVGRSAEPEGWLIELLAKPGLVGLWQRIEYVVTDDGLLPLVARSYDRKNRLARVVRFDDVRVFGRRRIPARMVLTPIGDDGSAAKDQRTEMRYLEVIFDAEVPESTFSLSRLERGQ